jgi:hypothetical protein
MSFSPDRAQVEPLAALAAVFAVGVGLALYVGVLDVATPLTNGDREMAPAAADRVTAAASSFGGIEPPDGSTVAAARPTGYDLNVTLRTADASWAAGPPRTGDAACERRSVGVQVAPGRIRPGELEVCTWRAR